MSVETERILDQMNLQRLGREIAKDRFMPKRLEEDEENLEYYD